MLTRLKESTWSALGDKATKRHKTRKRFCAFLALVILSILARQSSAQQINPSEGVIRINVNLVQVDAIVTDGKGKPVLNLTADDFELLQDVKPEAITTFAFINVKDSKVNAAPLPSAPQTKNGPLPPSLPPMALRPDQIRRTIALVVDDLGLSADSTIRVRQSLKNWVDKELLPILAPPTPAIPLPPRISAGLAVSRDEPRPG